MSKEIDYIVINHTELGAIKINANIPDYINDLVGSIGTDYKHFSFYFGDIYIDNNGSVDVHNLNEVRTERVNVGCFRVKGRYKNFVTMYKNLRVYDRITIGSANLVSITYENMNYI